MSGITAMYVLSDGLLAILYQRPVRLFVKASSFGLFFKPRFVHCGKKKRIRYVRPQKNVVRFL